MRRKHPKHVPFNYNKINEYVYLGTNQCCQTHFNSKLLKKGIASDISLEIERMDHPIGVKYYLWLPVVDKKSPSKKQLLLGAKAIQACVENKMKVYVHCQWGHGRSPALVAAYLILTGMSANKAMKFVKQKRPEIHLNEAQKKGLRQFEKRLINLK